MRDMADYMDTIANKIYESKKQAFEKGDEAVSQQIGRGKDIISVLSKRLLIPSLLLTHLFFAIVRENLKASNEDRLADSEVIGQARTLFFLQIFHFSFKSFLP